MVSHLTLEVHLSYSSSIMNNKLSSLMQSNWDQKVFNGLLQHKHNLCCPKKQVLRRVAVAHPSSVMNMMTDRNLPSHFEVRTS